MWRKGRKKNVNFRPDAGAVREPPEPEGNHTGGLPLHDSEPPPAKVRLQEDVNAC